MEEIHDAAFDWLVQGQKQVIASIWEVFCVPRRGLELY